MKNNIELMMNAFINWKNKKLFFILSLILFGFYSNVQSQCLFNISTGYDIDTVCLNDTIRIQNYNIGAGCGSVLAGTKHVWSYQSVSLSYAPIIDSINTKRKSNLSKITTVLDSGRNYIFTTMNGIKPLVLRYDFDSNYSNKPTDSIIADLSLYTNHISGISIHYDSDSSKWYGYVLAGTDAEDDASKDKGRLIRLTFGDGLRLNPTKIENLGSYGSLFRNPSKITLVNDLNHWYGFVANAKGLPVVTLIDFTKGLGGDSASIIVENFDLDKTLFNNSQKGIASLAPIKIDGKWKVFCVNIDFNNVFRVDFETNFSSYTTTRIDDPNKTIKLPNDIVVTNDCNTMICLVTNSGDQTYSYVSFGYGLNTINTTKSAKKPEYMRSILGMSEVQRVQGNMYSFMVNNDGPIVRFRYSKDTVSHTIPAHPVDTGFAPALYQYKDTGVYVVTLTVDGDLSKTYCRTIYVMPLPSKPVINPYQLCVGDTLQLLSGYPKGAMYHWWLPDSINEVNLKYPIAKDTGKYKASISFDMCYSKKDSTNIVVSEYPYSVFGDTVWACPRTTSELSVYGLKLQDSLFVYRKDSILFSQQKVFTDYIAKYTSYSTDTVDGGVYHYVLKRKPKNKGNCKYSLSYPTIQTFVIARPKAPLILYDSIYVCNKTDNVRVQVKTGSKIKWYSDPNRKFLLTSDYSNFYVPTPSDLPNYANNFYATRSDGSCESYTSKPAVVIIYAKVTPVVPAIVACLGEGASVDPVYVKDVVGGATYEWSSDSLMSKIIGTDWYYNHMLIAPGHAAFWVRRTVTINSVLCRSTPVKATVTINKTEVPILLLSDPEVYSCIGKTSVALSIKADINAQKIEWFNNTNVSKVLSGSTSYTPTVSGTYKVRQFMNNCQSDLISVNYNLVYCDVSNVVACDIDKSYDLWNAIPKVTDRTYKWQDNDYTGKLTESILDISDMHNTAHYFQNKNQLVALIVEKKIYPGTAKSNPVNACSTNYSLYDALSGYDMGGQWFVDSVKLFGSTTIKPKPVSHIYKYIMNTGINGCPIDFVVFTLKADTTLRLVCDHQKNIFLDEGTETYTVPDNSIDVVVEDVPSCKNYSMYIIYDSVKIDESSLYNRTLLIGNHKVDWVATNIFTKKSVSCTSYINITPIFITNLFSPNGDGVNDYWEIDLRKYPENLVRVFNRWGQYVYQSTNQTTIQWDGTYRGTGRPAPDDGYMYIITDGNENVISKGTITLMR